MSEDEREILRQYVSQYGGLCRDCADCSGTCQDEGVKACDPAIRRRQILGVIGALDYGFTNGFIKPPSAWNKQRRPQS